MAQLVLVALTALAAVAGYREAAKLAHGPHKRFVRGTPMAWGISCGVAGLVGAVFVPAMVLGALAALVGYNDARNLEQKWRETPFGVAAPAWAVGCGVFGFGGAVLTSTSVWLVVCGFVALGAAQFLLIDERNTLADEKRVLLAENGRLIAKKSANAPVERVSPPAKTVGTQAGVASTPGAPPQLWDQNAARWRASSPQRSAAEPERSAWSARRPLR